MEDFLSLIQDEKSLLTIVDINGDDGTFTFKLKPDEDNHETHSVIFSLLHIPTVFPSSEDENPFFIAVKDEHDNYTNLKKYTFEKGKDIRNLEKKDDFDFYYSRSLEDYKNDMSRASQEYGENILFNDYENEQNKKDMSELVGWLYYKIEDKWREDLGTDDEKKNNETFLTIITALNDSDAIKEKEINYTIGLTIIKSNDIV